MVKVYRIEDRAGQLITAEADGKLYTVSVYENTYMRAWGFPKATIKLTEAQWKALFWSISPEAEEARHGKV